RASASPANTAARWASSPTARSPSTSPTPRPRATPCWTPACTCPRNGPATATVAWRRGCPRAWSSAPSRSWAWSWSATWGRASAWQRLCFRDGSQGPQQADFGRVRWLPERDDLPGPECWLMLERGCDQQPYAKYYLSNAAADCPLVAMAAAGHTRWPVEDCF